MKKTIYLLAFLWAFFGQLNAQFDMEVKFGELGKLSPPIHTVQLESGQLIYAKSVGPAARVVFDLLDDQMNILKSVKSDFVFISKNWKSHKYLRALEFWGGKLYAFYSITKDGDSYEIYAEEIDQATLNLSGTPIAIGDFEKRGQIPYKEKMYFIKSMDEQRLLIYVKERRVKNEINTRNEYLQMMVLDEALEMQWQNGLLVSSSEEENIYKDVVVNNAGETFVLEQKFIFKQNGHNIKYTDYNYTLYKFDSSGRKLPSKKLKLEDRNASILHLSMGPNEDLLVSGVFFNPEGENGILYMRFNSLDLSVQETAFNVFDSEYILQGYSGLDNKFYDTSIPTSKFLKQDIDGDSLHLPISIREVIHRPNGGVIILGERFNRNNYDNKYDNKSVYFFGEIYILHLDEKGHIDWKRKIMKRQEVPKAYHSPERGLYTYGSFTYAIQDDNIIVLFNDHEQNVELYRGYRDGKAVYSYKNSKNALNAVRIDDTGNMEREQIFLTSDHEVVICPACSKPLNKQRTELVLFGDYKYKKRLGHLIVE